MTLVRRMAILRAMREVSLDGRCAPVSMVDAEMRVACDAVCGSERPRQSMGPSIEEGLHVARPQSITGSLQSGGIGTREESVVEALKTNVLTPELLLHPLVPVQTDLDRIRQIGTDLEEARPQSRSWT